MPCDRCIKAWKDILDKLRQISAVSHTNKQANLKIARMNELARAALRAAGVLADKVSRGR